MKMVYQWQLIERETASIFRATEVSLSRGRRMGKGILFSSDALYREFTPRLFAVWSLLYAVAACESVLHCCYAARSCVMLQSASFARGRLFLIDFINIDRCAAHWSGELWETLDLHVVGFVSAAKKHEYQML